MTIVNFTLKNLESVAPIRAKKDALKDKVTGVFFDSDNNKLVATNGHLLAIVDQSFDECLSFKSFILDSDSVNKIIKHGRAFAKTHKIPRLALDIDTDAKTCRFGNDTISINFINESYVDYSRPIPEANKAESVPFIGINAEFLALMQESMHKFYEIDRYSKVTPAIQLQFNGTESPIVLTNTCNLMTVWYGLIMPVTVTK